MDKLDNPQQQYANPCCFQLEYHPYYNRDAMPPSFTVPWLQLRRLASVQLGTTRNAINKDTEAGRIVYSQMLTGHWLHANEGPREKYTTS
eukprot:6175671-Pleurochrysis_carterae.AAC.1